MAMITSPAGVKAIQQHEGLMLEAYVDAAGVNTIGFGHTGSEYAQPGKKITKAKAVELLKKDLKQAEDAVNRLVKVDITQPMYDSLVSLAFNIGNGAFAKSTLLKKLNQGDYLGAADEFPRWRKAGGKVLTGLVKRRAAERAMFLSGVETLTTEDELESNIEPDMPLKQPVTASKPIQALGATTVAGTLASASETLTPLVEYSDYIRILWVILSVAAIGYFIYSRKED